jgi:ribosomal protein S18 acetylase RimI-like enzyme
MDTTVISLAASPDGVRPHYLSRAEDVFWETANTTEFSSPQERTAFHWRYFGYYAAHAPHLFLVALSQTPSTAPEVLGYICGVADTRSHGELYRIAAHVPVFDDLYESYPAHLHINLTGASRGLGVGGKLVHALASAVARDGAGGLHLVTTPGARNVSFYRRQGFVDAVERNIPLAGEQDVALLFLGKRL